MFVNVGFVLTMTQQIASCCIALILPSSPVLSSPVPSRRSIGTRPTIHSVYECDSSHYAHFHLSSNDDPGVESGIPVPFGARYRNTPPVQSNPCRAGAGQIDCKSNFTSGCGEAGGERRQARRLAPSRPGRRQIVHPAAVAAAPCPDTRSGEAAPGEKKTKTATATNGKQSGSREVSRSQSQLYSGSLSR